MALSVRACHIGQLIVYGKKAGGPEHHWIVSESSLALGPSCLQLLK